jgi:hypothetical protein
LVRRWLVIRSSRLDLFLQSLEGLGCVPTKIGFFFGGLSCP